jgi:hypothetical protein
VISQTEIAEQNKRKGYLFTYCYDMIRFCQRRCISQCTRNDRTINAVMDVNELEQMIMATAPCPRLDAFASIQARTDALLGDEWKGGSYDERHICERTIVGQLYHCLRK